METSAFSQGWPEGLESSALENPCGFREKHKCREPLLDVSVSNSLHSVRLTSRSHAGLRTLHTEPETPPAARPCQDLLLLLWLSCHSADGSGAGGGDLDPWELLWRPGHLWEVAVAATKCSRTPSLWFGGAGIPLCVHVNI